MKKISLILSAALLAIGLASCSQVTELNGSEYEVYKDPSKSVAAEEAAAAAAATTVTLKASGSNIDVTTVANYKALPGTLTAYYVGATTVLTSETTVQLKNGTTVIYETKLAKNTVLTSNWSSFTLTKKDLSDADITALGSAVVSATATLTLDSNL